MDISSIAHRRHDYCSPVSRETIEELIHELQLPVNARCADYGCGKGELLLDVLRANGTASGDGYDCNATFIGEAMTRAERLHIENRARFHVRQIESISADAAVDLAICFGSVHIFNGLRNALRALAEVVRPGGAVLIADGYWKREPSEHFLHEFFESAESDLLYMPQILRALDETGFDAAYVRTSSQGEWERYESLWSRELELAADETDDANVAAVMRERARKSRNNYWLHGGRETLGYVAVIANRPCR